MNDATLQFRIRPMRLEDVPAVQAIDNLSFSMPWPESAYHYELNENPLSLLWVAETETDLEHSSIIGLLVIWLVVDEAHIATLATHPDYRRHGIGLALLVTGLKAAIRKGMQQATLEVRAGNFAAQELYQRFGFRIVGRRPRYYRDNNEDALIMTAAPLDEDYQHWLEREGWKSGNN